MKPFLRPIIIALCIYFLFTSLTLIMYPDPVISTIGIKHIEREIYENKESSKPTTTYTEKAIFTAYTLSVQECDQDPTIGAGGHNLEDYRKRGVQVCASRNIPLHTVIDIEGFGSCEILDRTSKKYSGRIDILMDAKEEAIQFGKQEIRYRVIN